MTKKRRVINEPIAYESDGVTVAGGVNAVIETNVNEPGAKTTVSSKQRTRIVQRGGKTVVDERQTVVDEEASTRRRRRREPPPHAS